MLHFKQYRQTPLDSAHTETLPGLSPACICHTSLPRFSKVPCGFCDDKESSVIPEEPEPRTCSGWEAAVWQTCWISALLLTDSEVQSHLYLQRFSGDQCGLGLQVGAFSGAPWRFTGVERIKNHEKARFSDETGLSKVVTPEEKHTVFV